MYKQKVCYSNEKNNTKYLFSVVVFVGGGFLGEAGKSHWLTGVIGTPAGV